MSVYCAATLHIQSLHLDSWTFKFLLIIIIISWWYTLKWKWICSFVSLPLVSWSLTVGVMYRHGFLWAADEDGKESLWIAGWVVCNCRHIVTYEEVVLIPDLKYLIIFQHINWFRLTNVLTYILSVIYMLTFKYCLNNMSQSIFFSIKRYTVFTNFIRKFSSLKMSQKLQS